jgi:hypothetical protein
VGTDLRGWREDVLERRLRPERVHVRMLEEQQVIVITVCVQ